MTQNGLICFKCFVFMVTFLKWMLYSSLFAGFCALGLSMATDKLLTGSFHFSVLHLFIFANTITIYNVHYCYKQPPYLLSERYQWSTTKKNVHKSLIILGISISLACLVLLPITIWLASLALGVLALAYSFPLLPISSNKKLRNFGLLKPVLLSLVWVCVTTLLPAIYHQQFPNMLLLEGCKRFIFMLALCITFDIKDLATDRTQNTFTLAVRLGTTHSYTIIYILLICFSLLSFITFIGNWESINALYGNLALSLLALAAIQKTKLYKQDWYYLLVIDGLMLVYAFNNCLLP